jgi:hypothetical protein
VKDTPLLRLLPPSPCRCIRRASFIPLYRLPLNTHKSLILRHGRAARFVQQVQLLSQFYSIHTHDADRNIGDSESFRRADACEPSDPASNVTERLNKLLKNSGDGYVLQLCPNETYLIQAPIAFASPNQQISTEGYPTNDDRATLFVSGPVFANGTGHTTAVDGTCSTCSNVILRNIQVCRNVLDLHLPF